MGFNTVLCGEFVSKFAERAAIIFRLKGIGLGGCWSVKGGGNVSFLWEDFKNKVRKFNTG